ncbi:MAG: chemotaxis protein CheC [Oscillospiraceae bacterium]|jgi:chemotaxis protein CheC|nr:chemotaxis protein CheC [Oscillospiraceae bacterium]
MLKRYEDLNEIQLDVLKEIGNIGSGNASTALSSMIGKEILIKMPEVKTLAFQEAIESNGAPDDIVGAILVNLKGDISGMILMLTEKNFADVILSAFFGESDVDLLTLNDNQKSALSEIGNIMSSAYINAIATLSNLSIALEPPMFTADMLGAVMSVPITLFGEVGDKLLCINKTIQIDDHEYKSNMLLIPTVESLSVLFSRLGVS